MEETVQHLKVLPYRDLGFAKLDSHRSLRKGFPEVIFGEGKSPEQIAIIAKEAVSSSNRLLVTRASPAAYEAVRQVLPGAQYSELAHIVYLGPEKQQTILPSIPILSAGTADLPVPEEAAITAEVMGNHPERIYDVGVAGLHRLLPYLHNLEKARVIVVVAGMDGVLPSVVGGLVSTPIIAVPTSIGYGASFLGLSALLTMLNACAPGISVVNIDNGFGAGYMASLINQLPLKEK